MPGILQSPFLNRIGGSSRVRADLATALGEGRGVTAKIRWLTRPDRDGEGEGRPRWIHCTPLLGHSGAVGVWMIVLVDDEGSSAGQTSGRRFRQAPPVASNIGGKEWDPVQSGKNLQNVYDKENERHGGRGGGGEGGGGDTNSREYSSQWTGYTGVHQPTNDKPRNWDRRAEPSLGGQVAGADESVRSFSIYR